MKLSEADVRAEAEKLSLKLTDEEIKAYVLIGKLPAADLSNQNPDEDGDEDGKNKGKTPEQIAFEKRVKKISDDKKKLADDLSAANKRLADFEAKEKNAQTADAEKKGEWEKLKADADEAKKKSEQAVLRTKDIIKNNAVQSALKEGLLEAGIDKSMMTRALKLFELKPEDIFSWKDENALEYEISDFGSEIESFKKDNPFFFEGEDDGRPDSFSPGSPDRKRQKQSAGEQRQKELEQKFPALRQ